MVFFRDRRLGDSIGTGPSLFQPVVGTDRLLVVGTVSIESTFPSPSQFGTVTGVITSGGSPAQLLEERMQGAFDNGYTFEMVAKVWGLLAPPTGTLTVTVEGSGAYSFISFVANDVLQSDPYGATYAAAGSGTTVTDSSVSLATGEAVLQAYAAGWNGQPLNHTSTYGIMAVLFGPIGRAGVSLAAGELVPANWTITDAVSWKLKQLVLHTVPGGEPPPTPTTRRKFAYGTVIG